jgi:hypothetical protein
VNTTGIVYSNLWNSRFAYSNFMRVSGLTVDGASLLPAFLRGHPSGLLQEPLGMVLGLHLRCFSLLAVCHDYLPDAFSFLVGAVLRFAGLVLAAGFTAALRKLSLAFLTMLSCQEVSRFSFGLEFPKNR